MPNIPIAPSKPQASMKSIQPVQAKPIPKAPAKSPKITYSGKKTLPGGMTVIHTSEVIDKSGDTSQYLPFTANCLTCGWQARVKEKETAEMMAKGHVGQ